MHAPAAIVALAACFLAFLPSTQRRRVVEPTPPPQEDSGLPDWPGSRSRERSEALIEGLQGCWRLESIESAERGTSRNKEVGYMLVSGSHLSIEIHGDWWASTITPARSGTGPAIGGRLSTGIHSFELDSWQTMRTRTLIGTRDGLGGQIEFERPDTERRFTLELTDGQLAMTRDDGTVLRFTRVADGRRKVDFWGRPIVEEPKPARPVPEDEPAPDEPR